MLPRTASPEILNHQSGIILFAKRSGITSFSSLYAIKRALGTSKVGHTGTLDSFACGLLVICSGALTRLASRITAFDKTYEAVICFGEETDTLDPSGTVVRTAELPEKNCVELVLRQFTGILMQRPPSFSAIHVNGRRASDLTRAGISVEIPARQVFVYESKLVEVRYVDNDSFLPSGNQKIKYARIRFRVSKGTYIRSLARDIAAACGSAAYLVGLLRTSVGSFQLEDAAGYHGLPAFTIENVLNSVVEEQHDSSLLSVHGKRDDSFEFSFCSEIIEKLRPMTPALASECGFTPVVLVPSCERAFFCGQPLYLEMFTGTDVDMKFSYPLAVFTNHGFFVGVVEWHDGRLKYGFVIHE